MAVLDVRDDLAKGIEPFSKIMAAVQKLEEREDFTLIAPFEPAPLYEVMKVRGFSHSTTKRQDGSWKVDFTRSS